MKDAYYFSHDANARSDPKILAMVSRYGMEGYGRYWVIIETLREQEQYKLPHKQYIFDAIAMQMQCDCNAVNEFINACVDEFELLHSDGQFFWSNSLLKRMFTVDDKRQKAKKAADKRWSKCDSNADAMQTQCPPNAIKVNKSKENKSILNDYTDSPPLIEAVNNFSEMRRSIKKPMTVKALSMMLTKLDSLSSNDEEKIAILNQSTMNCWQGIFELKRQGIQATQKTSRSSEPEVFEC